MWDALQEIQKIIDVKSIGLGGLLGSAVLWLLQRRLRTRFEIQPRLSLRVNTSPYRGGGPGTEWEAGWLHYLTVQNDSRFDAFNLKFHFDKNHRIFTDLPYVEPFANGQRVRVPAGQSLTLETKTLLDLPPSLLQQYRRTRNRQREVALLENNTPPGLREPRIYLSYENELGQVFYVRYRREGRQSVSFFRPVFW